MTHLKRCSECGKMSDLTTTCTYPTEASRIASHQLGFDYWGWELDTDYYEVGNKRFKQQTAQQTLF